MRWNILKKEKEMYLIDAIKSEKPFKLPKHTEWTKWDVNCFVIHSGDLDFLPVIIHPEDVESDKWEIKKD